MNRLSLFAVAASLTIAISGAACSGQDPEPAPAEPLVKVPEVPSSVAVDALCDIAAQIQCAGSTECCGAKPPFGSVSECVTAYSSCSAQLAMVTESAEFKAGTISYNATTAATMLKEIADSTSHCGTAAPAFDLNKVFVGSLSKGADCSPKDQSGVFMLTCAPGLACNVLENNENGIASATCEDAVAAGNDEFAAVAPTVEEIYCVAPPDVIAPSNSDFVPTALSINTTNSENAGTTSDVTLHFIQKSRTTEYYCTISGGIAKNTTKICAPLLTRSWSNAPANDLFYVGNDSTDGLAVDSVAACKATNSDGTACSETNSSYTAGTFDNGNNSMLADKIRWAFGAFDDGFGHFYVDTDGSGNCKMAKIKFDDDNTVTCSADHTH